MRRFERQFKLLMQLDHRFRRSLHHNMDENNQQPQPTITPAQPPAAIPPVTPTPPIMPPQPPMSAPTPPISPPSQPAPHSPSPMIIGVIILVLVLVIGGVLIL